VLERGSGAHGDVRGQHSCVLGETWTDALQHWPARRDRPALRAAGAMPSALAADPLPRPKTLQLVHLLQRQAWSTLADRTPTHRHEEDYADDRRLPHGNTVLTDGDDDDLSDLNVDEKLAQHHTEIFAA